MSRERFDTTGFMQQRADVADAERTMVFGPGGRGTTAAPVARLAVLGMREQGTEALASLAASRLGLEARILAETAASQDVIDACSGEGFVLVPPLTSLRDASVCAALRACKVFHLMVNPARIAASKGLSGESAEAFCREAMELDALGMCVMQHPIADGKTPDEMLENVLESLGIMS